MGKICLYTCITGDYDDLNEIEKKEKNVDYICFTNNKNLTSKTWKIIHIEDEKLDNQRLSRKIKMLGHPYISENYDISVWMDASVIFKSSVVEFVNKYLKQNSFAAFKHHSRNCIFEEANACYRYKKETKENILKHIKFLEKEKYPHNNGLYEMTVFIKKHNDSIVKKTMDLWFDIVCNYSKRDQLSFMYCVWKTGMKIDDINLNVWDNNWFICKKHKPNMIINSYRVYFGDENNYDFNNDIQGDYIIKKNNYGLEITCPCDCNIASIHVCNVPMIEWDNIKISKKNITKKVFNYISYNKRNIFYNNDSVIVINGKFKKGEKIKFSINLNRLSLNDIEQYCEEISVNNILSSNKIKDLELKINSQQQYIEKMWRFINSSIICRIILKIKKIINKDKYNI